MEASQVFGWADSKRVHHDPMDGLTHFERLEAKLAPETMGGALIRAGAILAAYELVKSTILDGPLGFLAFNWDENGNPVPDASYETEVLARGSNKWNGSCAWLVHMRAITDEQVADLEDIRDHRGEVAHELARLLVDPDAEVRLDMLVQLRDIMRSLDRFFGSITVDINADHDDGDVDYDAIRSGSGLVIDYLSNLAGLDDAT